MSFAVEDINTLKRCNEWDELLTGDIVFNGFPDLCCCLLSIICGFADDLCRHAYSQWGRRNARRDYRTGPYVVAFSEHDAPGEWCTQPEPKNRPQSRHAGRTCNASPLWHHWSGVMTGPIVTLLPMLIRGASRAEKFNRPSASYSWRRLGCNG